MNIPELLAPAGDKECAVYAISAGATAVYLGLHAGSARAGAKNFTFEELDETLRYAHERGCRVYLALNILESDEELEEVTERAIKAAKLGTDAIIVQDLGLAAELIRLRSEGILPETIQIHASTQMSVCTPEGAEMLKKMGFDRLITAREMSLKGLKALADTGIPVECFVHGALCMSFSGQCLMSSYIGGRSGNRGTCAQPCRMEYILRDERDNAAAKGHLLSPDDFCALPLLDKLCETGVCSLKIEGRLKSPQYVAGVTRIYRKALGYVEAGTFGSYLKSEEYKKDMEELTLLFCRGSFTEGYLKGKLKHKDITVNNPGRKGLKAGELTVLPKNVRIKGAECDFTEIRARLNCEIEVNDGVTVLDGNDEIVCGGKVSKVKYINNTASLLLSGRQNKLSDIRMPLTVYITHKESLVSGLDIYNGTKEIRKCGISMNFTAHKGENATLTVCDGQGRSFVSCTEGPVSQALNAPMTEESVSKYLKKTGDTPYEAIDISFNIDRDIFMPAGEINALRRKALNGLSELRRTFSPVYSQKNHNNTFASRAKCEIKAGNTLYFYKTEDFLNSDSGAIRKIAPKIIYLPLDMWQDEAVSCKAVNEVKKYGAMLFAAMPFIPIGGEYEGISELVCKAAKESDGFLLTNLGDFPLVQRYNDNNRLILAADSSLNVWNSKTAEELVKMGAGIITLSPEAIRDGLVPDKVPQGTFYEMISDGEIPLMRTRYCLLSKGRDGCGACSGRNFSLEDTKGARYSIITKTRDCQNIILSPTCFPYGKEITEDIVLRRIQTAKELKL